MRSAVKKAFEKVDDDICIDFLEKKGMQLELMRGDWKKPEWLNTI